MELSNETKQRKNFCDVCDHQFSNPSDLKRHLSTDKHKINLCKMDAPSKISTEIKSYKNFCDVCDHQFGSPSVLKRHLSTDKHKTNLSKTPIETPIEKPIETTTQKNFCGVCDHQFGSSSDLKRHLSTDKHKNKLSEISEMRFFCEICEQRFPTDLELNEHLNSRTHKKRTEKLKPIAFDVGKNYCETCDYEFYNNSGLDRHLRTDKHKNKLKDLENGITSDPIEIYSLYCDSCDKDFCDQFGARRHFTSRSHKVRTERKNILNNNIDDDFCLIPIRNKIGEIIENVMVDKNIYPLIMDYSISLSGGYASIKIGQNSDFLSRYIYYNLQNRIPNPNMIIDHKDRNRMNDRLENLRETIHPINNRNRSKKKSATSKFHGVSRKEKAWVCRLQHNGQNHQFNYKDETWAAYHYDLLVIELGLVDICPLNNIDCPDGFIKKAKFNHIKKDGLPECIKHKSDGYCCIFEGKETKEYSKSGFKTVEDAVLYRDAVRKMLRDKKEENEKRRIENILNSEIPRNSDGIAFIELLNKSEEITVKVLLDDDDYIEISTKNYGLSLSKKGYIIIRINKSPKQIHRWILRYEGNLKVDHKNRNRLDNRKSNLRTVDDTQSAQNRGAGKNSSSKYVGVSRNENGKCITFPVHIQGMYLGSFKTEEEAVIVRNNKARELNEKGANYAIEYYGQYL